MDPKLVEVATNLLGSSVRHEQYMGREHVVVAAVLVKAKVLHNNLGRTLLPAEDVTPAWAELWNGMPVVVDHPRTSARTPEIMNELGVGTVHRARAQNGVLKADVFLDPTRAAQVADLKVVLEKLENGETVEVSTSFAATVDPTPGVFNGAEYDLVIHPQGPDHLAAFAEQIGACSVDDGCGLAANAQNCGCHKPAPADNQSDEDKRSLLHQALVAKFGADDRAIWVDSVFSDEGEVVFELISRSGDPSGLFRVEFEIDGNAVTLSDELEKVRRVTTYEPVGNAGDQPPLEEGSNMNRDELIARLAAAGPLDKETLAKLSDVQLRALDEPPPEDEGEALALAHKYRSELEELKAKTANALESEDKERIRLLDDVIYNVEACPWGEKEVRAMDIVQLRKVHAAMFPRRADFGGRGGPAATGRTPGFDFVQGIMDAPAGKSVLDRKETN